MKVLLHIISIVLCFNNLFGQTDTKSYIYRDSIGAVKERQHIDSLSKIFYGQPNYINVTIYRNNKEIKRLKGINVSLTSNGKDIKRIDTTDKILFPKISTSDSLTIKFKYAKKTIAFSGFFGKQINLGGDFFIVTISDFNKMTSVAKENDMDKSEADYSIYKSRFFVAKDFTIDLPDYDKIKRITFIIFKPKTFGDGTYILSTSTKNIKYK